MNLFTTIVAAFQIWKKYGTAIETLICTINDLSTLNNGSFFNDVDTVLKKHGIDLSASINGVSGSTTDMTSIKGIQTALNLAGANPQLEVDGLIGQATLSAVSAFQFSAKLVETGIPGAETVAALSAAVSKA